MLGFGEGGGEGAEVAGRAGVSEECVDEGGGLPGCARGVGGVCISAAVEVCHSARPSAVLQDPSGRE